MDTILPSSSYRRRRLRTSGEASRPGRPGKPWPPNSRSYSVIKRMGASVGRSKWSCVVLSVPNQRPVHPTHTNGSSPTSLTCASTKSALVGTHTTTASASRAGWTVGSSRPINLVVRESAPAVGRESIGWGGRGRFALVDRDWRAVVSTFETSEVSMGVCACAAKVWKLIWH